MNYVFMIGKVIARPLMLSSDNIKKITSYFSIEVEMNESKKGYRIDAFNIVSYGTLSIYLKTNLKKGDTIALKGSMYNKLINKNEDKGNIEIIAESVRIVKKENNSLKKQKPEIIEYDDDIPDFVRVNPDPDGTRMLDETPY